MNNLSKPTTIYDIAQKVNLTPNTVSRVLNNKGYISDKTRSKVLKAAAELNYQPNQIAKSLKTSVTKQIMLAVPFIREAFNFDLIAAVQEVVRSHGYSLVLSYTEADETEELNAMDNLLKNHADGLILTTINISGRLMDKVSHIRKPCVFSCFCKYSAGDVPFDYVGVDTKKGIYLATRHLIDQGHTKIAYIGPELAALEGRERFEGYCLAMHESGLDVAPSMTLTGGHNDLFGYESGQALLRQGNLPTAICAGTDLIVLGLYRIFEQNRVSVPGQVSITGMDNIDICSLVKPKITSVAIGQAEIGRMAAEMLFERLISKEEAGHRIITLEPRLIVRESSVNFTATTEPRTAYEGNG
jgi:LacI family transcriptional regulator